MAPRAAARVILQFQQRACSLSHFDDFKVFVQSGEGDFNMLLVSSFFEKRYSDTSRFNRTRFYTNKTRFDAHRKSIPYKLKSFRGKSKQEEISQ